MKRIFNEIQSFRLGYTEQRPYPWRWATPIVLCAFFLISPFLALVNVPLSAYNIVQEFTYRPNDTLPPVFLANLVPSTLQNPTNSFTPQLLSVGDTIAFDNYLFNYTISQAFDGVDTVSTFLYYNNPFSDSCDVANITVQSLLSYAPEFGCWITDVQLSGTVACDMPSFFYLTWRGGFLDGDQSLIRYMPAFIGLDLIEIFFTGNGPGSSYLTQNFTQFEITFTVHPCCDCDAVLAGAPLEGGTSLLESPCSSSPAQFVVVDIQEAWFDAEALKFSVPVAPISRPITIADLLTGISLGNASISALSTGYENLIQSLYHLVRLDLGVILENQMYNSPEMFNRSISPLDLGLDGPSSANTARNMTSNATLMTQWQKEVDFFQNNTRVPPLEYLRSVPRLKPLGSAMTSVFVSTFAMLSVMWTVFSLVAGALARKHRGKARNGTPEKKHTSEQSRTWDTSLESGIEDGSEVILLGDQTEPDAVERLRQRMDRNEGHTRNDIEVIRVALRRLTVALKKHGLMDDEDWVQDDDTTVE